MIPSVPRNEGTGVKEAYRDSLDYAGKKLKNVRCRGIFDNCSPTDSD